MCEVSSWSLMFATALLVLQATFQSPRLVESSGVAVSRAYPGVLWTHNDSGDGPYLYATDLRGTDRGALLVPGAQAIDWEDMSLGPCPVAFPLQPRPPQCKRRDLHLPGRYRGQPGVPALRTYTEIYLFYPGVGGRLLLARARPCDISGLEVGGEAIDFLDDSTFVLTSEAGRRRPGTIDTVTCGLSREQRPQ